MLAGSGKTNQAPSSGANNRPQVPPLKGQGPFNQPGKKGHGSTHRGLQNSSSLFPPPSLFTNDHLTSTSFQNMTHIKKELDLRQTIKEEQDEDASDESDAICGGLGNVAGSGTGGRTFNQRGAFPHGRVGAPGPSSSTSTRLIKQEPMLHLEGQHNTAAVEDTHQKNSTGGVKLFTESKVKEISQMSPSSRQQFISSTKAFGVSAAPKRTLANPNSFLLPTETLYMPVQVAATTTKPTETVLWGRKDGKQKSSLGPDPDCLLIVNGGAKILGKTAHNLIIQDLAKSKALTLPGWYLNNKALELQKEDCRGDPFGVPGSQSSVASYMSLAARSDSNAFASGLHTPVTGADILAEQEPTCHLRADHGAPGEIKLARRAFDKFEGSMILPEYGYIMQPTSVSGMLYEVHHHCLVSPIEFVVTRPVKRSLLAQENPALLDGLPAGNQTLISPPMPQEVSAEYWCSEENKTKATSFILPGPVTRANSSSPWHGVSKACLPQKIFSDLHGKQNQDNQEPGKKMVTVGTQTDVLLPPNQTVTFLVQSGPTGDWKNFTKKDDEQGKKSHYPVETSTFVTSRDKSNAFGFPGCFTFGEGRSSLDHNKTEVPDASGGAPATSDEAKISSHSSVVVKSELQDDDATTGNEQFDYQKYARTNLPSLSLGDLSNVIQEWLVGMEKLLISNARQNMRLADLDRCLNQRKSLTEALDAALDKLKKNSAKAEKDELYQTHKPLTTKLWKMYKRLVNKKRSCNEHGKQVIDAEENATPPAEDSVDEEDKKKNEETANKDSKRIPAASPPSSAKASEVEDEEAAVESEEQQTGAAKMKMKTVMKKDDTQTTGMKKTTMKRSKKDGEDDQGSKSMKTAVNQKGAPSSSSSSSTTTTGMKKEGGPGSSGNASSSTSSKNNKNSASSKAPEKKPAASMKAAVNKGKNMKKEQVSTMKKSMKKQ
ncbi:unnamed protein product [Amoebophrya sp. A25]|nr:unnamed protein product [Amoebophrya sp. A25]|eukprot:GSA25T00017334001.1